MRPEPGYTASTEAAFEQALTGLDRPWLSGADSMAISKVRGRKGASVVACKEGAWSLRKSVHKSAIPSTRARVRGEETRAHETNRRHREVLKEDSRAGGEFEGEGRKAGDFNKSETHCQARRHALYYFLPFTSSWRCLTVPLDCASI
jgi:hypothetical protein